MASVNRRRFTVTFYDVASRRQPHSGQPSRGFPRRLYAHFGQRPSIRRIRGRTANTATAYTTSTMKINPIKMMRTLGTAGPDTDCFRPALAAEVSPQGERATNGEPEDRGVEERVEREAGPDGAEGQELDQPSSAERPQYVRKHHGVLVLPLAICPEILA